MPIATLADYKMRVTAPASPRVSHFDISTPNSTNAGRFWDQWLAMGGVIPTTPVSPGQFDAGAIGQVDGSGTALRIVGADMGLDSTDPILDDWSFHIIDRLVHMGGLSGTALGEQTTNLPTSALPRYTSGEGVMAGIRIWAGTGGGVDFSIRYTNQAGTPNQVSPSHLLSSTLNSFYSIPLAVGDTGIRSIEGFTLSASSGTVGNIGLVLYKPLVVLSNVWSQEQSFFDLITGRMHGGLPEVLPGACLSLITVSAHVASGSSLMYNINFYPDS